MGRPRGLVGGGDRLSGGLWAGIAESPTKKRAGMRKASVIRDRSVLVRRGKEVPSTCCRTRTLTETGREEEGTREREQAVGERADGRTSKT